MKIIIIGASSGIGEACVRKFSEEWWEVGLTARRVDRMKKIQAGLLNKSYVKAMDVTKFEDARTGLLALIEDMWGVDVVFYNAGIGIVNEELNWDKDEKTIDVDVKGFVNIAQVAVKYFMKKKSGHFVVTSSIAALIGIEDSPAYGGSKAFVSNYMEGLRKKIVLAKLSIAFTDLQPGYVDTPMQQPVKGEMFWVASPEKAAKQIFRVIVKRKRHAYITHKWWWFAQLMKVVPRWLYERVKI